ncbi:MAG: hypothetical protein AAGJ18_20100 [Bacteroidota bacterium]
MFSPNFSQLLEQAALIFYDTYLKADSPVVFFQEKLPKKYGIGAGYLVNAQKEVSELNTFIFDQNNAINLPLGENTKTALFPCNQTYATVSFLQELNQQTLQSVLQKDAAIAAIYDQQFNQNAEKNTLLSVWIANTLAPFLALNDLEDRLLAEEKMPDLVIIMDRGVLAILNEHTIKNVFDLATPNLAQSFERTVIENLVGIAQKTVRQQYLKLAATAAYKNAFYGYILLLELLKNQQLLKGGISPELAAIW